MKLFKKRLRTKDDAEKPAYQNQLAAAQHRAMDSLRAGATYSALQGFTEDIKRIPELAETLEAPWVEKMLNAAYLDLEEAQKFILGF